VKRGVYYNEIDPKAAAWIRELITAGLIPEGEIDERSIIDIRPDDVRSFRQCHFFAGIAGWSLALQLAGWPDDREVWTGSCPCQPFSCAGKGLGEADERHLWPYFRNLIGECRPQCIFGEQVGSKAGRLWLAGVQADLEKAAYAVGRAVVSAAGVGAPHIRRRIYWMALSQHAQRWADSARNEHHGNDARRDEAASGLGTCGESNGMALTEGGRQRADGGASREPGYAEQCEQGGRLGNASSDGCEVRSPLHGEHDGNGPGQGCDNGGLEYAALSAETRQRPEPEHLSRPSGFWRHSAWHHCLDGKARRIPARAESLFQQLVARFSDSMDSLRPEDGFPLCEKIEGRAALLKGYGNAIVPPLAAEFIQAMMESL
jgi:DNA (cytosine-5)-methyltransferase 1